ncbi:hypothetical protein [Bradyrhizobium nitroreducens]|uniref:hypothetical protein n=1 Tax=Bradyrhizobium nitroreducens TaxID=709803 RepID=UPI003221DA3D
MNVPAPLTAEDFVARGTRSDQLVATVVFALLAVGSLLPTLLVPIPAMGDYVNHLARMYLLSEMGATDANPYYEAAWAFYPNLAMDLVVPRMARLFGTETATRLFLLVSQIPIVGGALALEWVVKRRVHLAGFAALMLLYCLPFSLGVHQFRMRPRHRPLRHRRLSGRWRSTGARAFRCQRSFRRAAVCVASLRLGGLRRDARAP